MKHIYFTLFILIIKYCDAQNTVGLIQHNVGTLDNGYVLFAPISSNNTYLIDKCGNLVKSWASGYKPGQSCYILPDGTLLRSGNANNTIFNAGGKGGIIEKIDWTGTVTWSYTLSSTAECQHHDIKPLSNGNILAIVWESKTNTEAIAQGRNPSLTTTTVWSEKIVEIQPVGLTGGTIVWEWHLWDHLIQDFDNTKVNYGTVASNPQLVNINYSASSSTVTGQDWIHLNSIDYNETLNQILVSSHSFDEVWIIDHSTTTSQAASHTGGNSNKGGDLLYRWGNPRAYNNGSISTQKFFGQHNAHWIQSGFPYQNQIMVFNNGNGRTGGNYSTIEIINPPVSGYTYTSTLPFLPSITSWMYNTANTYSLYAQNISGAEQLSNGNVIFCNGPNGTFKEINATGTTLWEYVNPVNGTGVISQGTAPTLNLAFRCSFYPSDYAGFIGKTIVAGGILENVNTVSSSCNLASSLPEVLSDLDISFFPNPANDKIAIQLKGLTTEQVNVELYDVVGILVQKSVINQGSALTYLDTRTLYEGTYFVKLINNNSVITKKVVVIK